MRPILKMRIENWQSHADSTFTFHPLFNIISGSSHSGKSSIIRALAFVLYNQVPGRKFVRHGKDCATVTIWFADGVSVKRTKGKTKNEVAIKYPPGHPDIGEDGQNPKVYPALGRDGADYPPLVVKALGNPPKDRFHGPTSISKQKSPDFLVSLSDTDLPRAMSEITGIADLEEAAKEIGTKRTSAKKQAKEADGRVEKIDKGLVQYDGLDAELERLERSESLVAKIEERLKKAESARRLVGSHEQTIARGKTYRAELDQAKRLLVLAPRVTAASARLDTAQEAYGLLEDAALTEQALRLATKEHARASKVVALLRDGRLVSAAERLERAKKAKDLAESWLNIMAQGKEASQKRKEAQTEITDFTAGLEALKAELLASGEMCGQCGQLVGVAA
jgi:exonuclease SbcC